MDFILLYVFNIFKFNTICALFCLFVKLECLPLLHSLKMRKASPCCPGPACPLQRLPTQEWEWGGLRGQGGKRTKQRTWLLRDGEGRPPQKMEFIYKKLCILMYLHFRLLQSTLHLMQNTYQDVFSTLQNGFWISILMTFRAFAVFCFTSSTSAKHFPLRTFFIWGNKKKRRSGEIGWIGSMEHRGHTIFGQKLLEHSTWCGQVCS